jgi:hypothetical protein
MGTPRRRRFACLRPATQAGTTRRLPAILLLEPATADRGPLHRRGRRGGRRAILLLKLHHASPMSSTTLLLQRRGLHELRRSAGGGTSQFLHGDVAARWPRIRARRSGGGGRPCRCGVRSKPATSCPYSPRSSASSHRPLDPNPHGSPTAWVCCAKGGERCWRPSCFAARGSSPSCCRLAPFADARRGLLEIV